MSQGYEVIARRWRPKRFSELVGQEPIVRTLKNAIEHNRLAHAYLFIGPRGTGKTTTARLFAMAINAPGGPSSEADPQTQRAQSILKGTCLDVVEIDGASNNGVEQVRQLREECQYAPAECKYKLYIIDEVHMLSSAAFNALLKTLEEPPAHVKFIFATTEAQKVPATIASRCQRLTFRPISKKIITETLAHIAQAEGVSAEPEVLESIALLSDGGMRDAQSMLDQLIAFCGKTLTQQDLAASYGLASKQEVDTLVQAITHYNLAALTQQVDQLVQAGRDLHLTLQALEQRFHEALIEAAQNQQSSAEPLLRMLDVLHSGRLTFAQGLSENIHFEVLLLKAAHEGQTRSIDSLIQELTQQPGPEQLPGSTQALIKELGIRVQGFEGHIGG